MALIGAILKGTTDVSVTIKIVDASTGAPKTDVVYNSAGIDLAYRRAGAAVATITEVTQTVSGAHADGGFVHIRDGLYRLDLPDAACASGVDMVEVLGTVTGGIIIGGTIQLTGVNLQDGVRAGLTALPNAAAAASGGLFTRGTGAGQINQDANGRIDVNVAAISTDATAADNLESYCDGTTPQPVNVTTIANNAITAAAIASNALSSSKFASGALTSGAFASGALAAAAFASDALSAIATALLDLTDGVEDDVTLREFCRAVLAVNAGESSGLDTGSPEYLAPDGTTPRVSGNSDTAGNRSNVVLSLS